MEEGLGWTGSERRRRICRELGGETKVSVEQESSYSSGIGYSPKGDSRRCEVDSCARKDS